ncbi:AcrR family transcriptional regulator [Actinoalloteichus hoggarensis]|nr:AcrR family transcriptional regulator [Actinoalloteichus hoggarensis]
MTAPALYRYYDSREDLLRHVGDDICMRLAAELTSATAELDESDVSGRVFAVCRRLRTWALDHPHEFELVFASRDVRNLPGQDNPLPDRFAQIFLVLLGDILAKDMPMPETEDFPPDLEADLTAARDALIANMSSLDITLPPQLLQLEALHSLLRWWVRVYGHIALEVFGRFPFDVRNAERLYEAMLTELAEDTGVCGH